MKIKNSWYCVISLVLRFCSA